MLKKQLSVVLRTVAEVETRRESKRTKVQTAVSWVVCVVCTSLVSLQFRDVGKGSYKDGTALLAWLGI